MEGWQQAGARIAQTMRAEKMERWEEVIQELLLEKSGCQGIGVVLYFSIGISVQRTGMQVLGAREWGSASRRPKVEKMDGSSGNAIVARKKEDVQLLESPPATIPHMCGWLARLNFCFPLIQVR